MLFRTLTLMAFVASGMAATIRFVATRGEDAKYELCKKEYEDNGNLYALMPNKTDCLHYIECHVRRGGKEGVYLVNSFNRHCGFNVYFKDGICAGRWSDIDWSKTDQNECNSNMNPCRNQAEGAKFPLHDAEPNQCGQFLECDGDGNPHFRCCPRGYKFEVDKCVKDVNKTCHDNCPAQYVPPNPDVNATTTVAPVKKCDKKVVPGSNGTQYTVGDSTLKARCPQGTIFNETNDVCRCENDPNFVRKPNDCKLVLDLDFKLKNSAFQWMYVEYMSVNRTDGIVVFSKPKAAVRIPAFENNENMQKKFTINIIFKDTSTGTERQTLVSTCYSKSSGREVPSMSVELENGNERVFFAVKIAEGEVQTMNTTYKKGEWNYLQFVFIGRAMGATVVPIDSPESDPSKATGKFSTALQVGDAKNAHKRLEKGCGPLTLGHCQDGTSNHFNGEVALLQVSFDNCSEENINSAV